MNNKRKVIILVELYKFFLGSLYIVAAYIYQKSILISQERFCFASLTLPVVQLWDALSFHII